MDYRKITYQIEEADAGRTVLSYLKQRGYSSRVLSALKRNPYGITIGKKRVTVQKQLRAGDTLTVRIANRKARWQTSISRRWKCPFRWCTRMRTCWC